MSTGLVIVSKSDIVSIFRILIAGKTTCQLKTAHEICGGFSSVEFNLSFIVISTIEKSGFVTAVQPIFIAVQCV